MRRSIVTGTPEDSFIDELTLYRCQLRLLEGKGEVQEFKYDLCKRISEVLDAARYVHTRKHTDEMEYKAFVAGLAHVLHLIRKTQ